MARRARGRCRVKLYSPGCRFRMRYEGTAVKTTAAELQAQGHWSCDTFDGSELQLVNAEVDGTAALPKVGYLALPGRRGGFGSARYLDAGQQIGLDWWNTTGGVWEELADPEYPGKLLFQRRGADEGQEPLSCSATSTFVLPPNPAIEVCLWRGEPGVEHDRASCPPATRLQFGLDAEEFALVLPYGGAAAHVQINNTQAGRWERLEPTEGTLPAIAGLEKGRRLWISICCHGGVLCVSFGRGQRGEGDTAYFAIPGELWHTEDSGGAVEWVSTRRLRGVREGQLRIVHTGGQMAFRWFPIYHAPGQTTLQCTAAFEAGYTLWHPEAPEPARMTADSCDLWQQVVWQADGASPTGLAVVPDSGATVTPYNPGGAGTEGVGTTYSWRVSWEPVCWKLRPHLPPGTAGPGIDYRQGPMVFAVQCRAAPYVGDSEQWPPATDISGLVRSVEVHCDEDRPVSMARLRLGNESGAFLAVKSNQLIEIELGYAWDDGTDELAGPRAVFVGYVQTPGKAARVGAGETADLVAYCPFIRLRDERAHSNEPDFQGFTATDAVRWLAQRAGFHETQLHLEGSDEPMYLGFEALDGSRENGEADPTNDSLLPAFGTELIDSVLEYCRRDGESLLWVRPYDAGGQKFQLCKSAGAYGPEDGELFELQEDAGPGSPGMPGYHLYALSVEQVPMDPAQYADMVVVRGRTPGGVCLQAAAGDFARLLDPEHPSWSGGWRHMHCEARDHLQDPAILRRRAQELLAQRSHPALLVTAETDLLWCATAGRGVHKGDRFIITHSQGVGKASRQGVLSFGADLRPFRVVAFRHLWDGPGSMPRTVVIGRAMWT